jgi:hypothetical protein
MFADCAPQSTRLDMTISRSEFARRLAAAFPGMRQPQALTFCGDHLGCRWSVQLQPAPPSRLGAIELERCTVDVVLQAQTPQQRRAWWQRFSAHFQKGGG